MLGRRDIQILCATLFVLPLSFSVRAGEKLDLRSSTAIELPKPADVEPHSSTPIDRSGQDIGAGSFAPVGPSAPPASPLLNRKLRELNDRRNNWIFMKPEEMLMDQKTSSFLEQKDRSGSLLDYNNPGQKEKTAQEKFWAERDRGKMDNSDSSSSRDPNDLKERTRFEMMKIKERNENLKSNSSAENGKQKLDLFGGRTQGSFLQENDNPNSASSFDVKKPEFFQQPFANGFMDDRPKSVGFDKDEIKKMDEQRDADFRKLIAPHSPGPGFNTALDPLNTQIDSTRMDANPITSRSANFLGSDNRQSSFLENEPKSSFRPEIPGNSMADLLPKAPTASALAPSASPASSFQSPISASRPFIFEMPKRAF